MAINRAGLLSRILYHWMALLSVMAGMALTAFPGGVSAPGGVGSDPSSWLRAPTPWFHAPTPGLLALTLAMGLAAWFAMGVDFPGSNRRFSRLAEARGEARLLGPEELR